MRHFYKKAVLYDFNIVISEELLDETIDYKPYINIIKSAEKIIECKKDHSEFFVNFLDSIKGNKDKAYVIKKLKFGLFIEALIKFHLLPKFIRQDSQILSDLTGIHYKLIDYFITLFTEPNINDQQQVNFVKTTSLQLKSTFYILISSLMLFSYQFNVFPLCKSLKLDYKTMIQYCKEIGCNTNEKNSKTEKVIVTFKALNLKQDKYARK